MSLLFAGTLFGNLTLAGSIANIVGLRMLKGQEMRSCLLPIKLEAVFVSYLAIQREREREIIFSERIEIAGDSTSKNHINVPIESIFNVKEQLQQRKKVK